MLHLRIYVSQGQIPKELRFEAAKHDTGIARFIAAHYSPAPSRANSMRKPPLDRSQSTPSRSPPNSRPPLSHSTSYQLSPLPQYTLQPPTQTQVTPVQTIRFLSGRPQVEELIEAEIEATAPTDRVAVGVCGPTSLTQSIAAAVAKAIKPDRVLRGENRRNVKLSNEEFGW